MEFSNELLTLATEAEAKKSVKNGSLLDGVSLKKDEKPEKKKSSDMENYRKSISEQMDQADNADADNENHTDGEVK